MTAKVVDKTTKPEIIRRKFFGVVVSAKSDKTIVVKVESVKIHPKYKKRYTVSRNYKVHDEKNVYKAGDKVYFVECRPLSRDKRWRVISN
jgi:small subunit ribosomal protein S17